MKTHGPAQIARLIIYQHIILQDLGSTGVYDREQYNSNLCGAAFTPILTGSQRGGEVLLCHPPDHDTYLCQGGLQAGAAGRCPLGYKSRAKGAIICINVTRLRKGVAGRSVADRSKEITERAMVNTTKPKAENELILTLLSAQFPAVSERINKQPEYRLMWAVLQDAIDTYMKHIDAKRLRYQHRFREVEEWIEQDDPTWLFSFTNICHVLGLDPDYLRNGLRHWRDRRSAAIKDAA